MTETRDQEPTATPAGADDRPAKVPLTARLVLQESLTARRAALIIAGFTLVVTVGGGILERVFDQREYPTLGKGLWFALQTVTTVGYGDVTPTQSIGRIIATVIMLAGIGFLAVITASVTATLIESSRRRFARQEEADIARWAEQVNERLAGIERRLGEPSPPRSTDGID